MSKMKTSRFSVVKQEPGCARSPGCLPVLRVLAVFLLLPSVCSSALQGPVDAPPGTYTLTYDGSQVLGLSEDGNMARSNSDGWWVVGSDGTHPQGTVGKTAYVSGLGISSTTTVYWGPAAPDGVALSLQPGTYVAGEVMTFNAGQSSPATGILRFTGSTTIHIVEGEGIVTPYVKNTRWTMTVTDASSGTPVSLTTAAALGLPPGIGALVPFTSPDQARKIKPSIPEYSADGFLISDELDFELLLG